MKCKKKSCKEAIASYRIEKNGYVFKYRCSLCSSTREVLIDSADCDTIEKLIESMK